MRMGGGFGASRPGWSVPDWPPCAAVVGGNDACKLAR